MVGLDVTHRALVTRAHAERLRGDGPAGRLAAELLRLLQPPPPRAATAGMAPPCTTPWPSPT